ICQRLVRYGRGDISIRNQTAPDGLSGTVVTIHFLHENGGRDGDNSSTG
ncbi:TPA: sensor histidine kinase, partial [Salmonella enterica subsp. enterica serovar Paratyphi C]|nr:sensor histidine kinase [Salmonella enterica subsp. enterica serovar Paratyphi C]